MNKPPLTPARQSLRRTTRRSFTAALLAAGAGFLGWRWLGASAPVDGVPWPLRRWLQFNEWLAQAWFNPARLSPTFPRAAVQGLRANGEYGLTSPLEVEAWRLRLEGLAGGQPVELTLAQVQALPRVEMTTQLRCIEGWSVVNHWVGARLADVVALHPPATATGGPANYQQDPHGFPAYVGLATPDGEYYVGLDAAAALHPQTLLCYEMNGAPLSLEHGAPLRLAIPVKYGIKNLKRIGTIRFTHQRPPDYWAEQGYDYYAGL